MKYNGLVLCRVLVITDLIIHECPRHHCNCYTSEIRPTPHFAASICSYCYVNALSDVAYVLISRGVICGSWTPRLFCTTSSTFTDPNFYSPQNKRLFFPAEEVLSSGMETPEIIWQSQTPGPHVVYIYVRVCMWLAFFDYTPQYEKEKIMHYLAILLLCDVENAWSQRRSLKEGDCGFHFGSPSTFRL